MSDVAEDGSFNKTYVVRAEGYILVPRVGRIQVAGLDMKAAEKRIHDVFCAAYKLDDVIDAYPTLLGKNGVAGSVIATGAVTRSTGATSLTSGGRGSASTWCACGRRRRSARPPQSWLAWWPSRLPPDSSVR